MTSIRLTALLLLASLGTAVADDAAAPPAKPPVAAPTNIGAGLKSLNPQGTVLIDPAKHRLVLKTEVVLRAGLLEMLICKARTKEHESILAVKSDAYVIHAGLLALGAQVGTPVRYEPKFQAPTGQAIDIVLHWNDAMGQEQSASAKTWIRHAVHRYYSHPLPQLPQGVTLAKENELRYDPMNKELIWFGPMKTEQRDELLKLSQDSEFRKGIEHFYNSSQSRQLEAGWVFAGSGFYEQGDGTKYYQAEDGNVVCVANFGDALLDLSVESSANNDGLQFEPWTERIPPLGTPVEVELILVQPKAAGGEKTPAP
jgi:hypothetical protein